MGFLKVTRLLALGLFPYSSLAQGQDFEFLPGVDHDESVPSLRRVVGHDWGAENTSPEEVKEYLEALSAASPEVSLVRYGESWEKRPLYYLVVASRENQTRLEQIKAGMVRLADPRSLGAGEAETLMNTLPAVVWLAAAVHGNETSSTEAALLTAYHLAAAGDDELADLVKQTCVVIIDPLQNPDGRARSVSHYRSSRGRWPDPDPQSVEHNEPWPGGRTNHYLFDLNRDWFALTQNESRGKVGAYLNWYPLVLVDLHEMGSNSTYYFPPPAAPLNPEISDSQVRWLETFGRNNAEWFDRMRFDYFTREIFDAFYPGYGVSWPTAHGTIGMTYEQASTRGLVVKRDDETLLHYREAVFHHFIASLATLQTAALHREALLRDFYTYRRNAVSEGLSALVQHYVLVPGRDPLRVQSLVSSLMAQGIEVKQAHSPFSSKAAADYYGEDFIERSFPEGSFVVSVAQPAKHLVETLLAKTMPMEEDFVRKQVERYRKRLSDQIYDSTAWSLPLIHQIEAYRLKDLSGSDFEILQESPQADGNVVGPEGALAYLVPWGTHSAIRALTSMLTQGIRVFSSDMAFQLGEERFPAGSLIIKSRDNPENLPALLAEVARSSAADIQATTSSWVEKGVNFGSNQVRFVESPRVAMLYREPVSAYSSGWSRFLLERTYSYPVTLLDAARIDRYELDRYSVLILPDSAGGYNGVLDARDIAGLKQWIESGGTLVAVGGATSWLTGENVGLLSSSREFRESKASEPDSQAEEEGAEGEGTSSEASRDIELDPEKELPGTTPGALMRVSLDTEHWLAFGYEDETNVMVSSRNIFTPLKLDKGVNVARYVDSDRLLLSGFTWEDNLRQLAGTSYLMIQRHGRGEVIAFAEDPNFRAFMGSLNTMFMNAVLFGPSR